MRISDWSSDVCSSDLPALGGAQQRREDLEVVLRLQHAEVAGTVVVPFQVGAIYLRGDAADRQAVAQGDPEARLRRLEEGVVARVEVLAPLQQQRRYPRRVIAVEAPGQAEKGVAGAGPLDHRQAQPAAGAAHRSEESRVGKEGVR